ncbi:peptidase S8/S53 domain-containing protein [Zopfochytrium polystomum]|nr:peptidase S8/S53 domain-containing protein [Zopfochytrium polystomum]
MRTVRNTGTLLVLVSLLLAVTLQVAGWAEHFKEPLQAIPRDTASPASSQQWAARLLNPNSGTPISHDEAKAFGNARGLSFLGPVGWAAEGVFLFETEKAVEDAKRKQVRQTEGIEVAWSAWQTKHLRYKRYSLDSTHVQPPPFKDPWFPRQWHLFNDGTNGIFAGHDINVVPVWQKGINGSGVTVAVIDDGVQYNHPDFHPSSWSAESSYDFNHRTNDASPKDPSDIHGTRCAGQIAAAPNTVCGVGVAFGAKISGLRLISEAITDATEAQALTYRLDLHDIYTSSWGPSDDGSNLEAPGPLTSAALEAGVSHGRQGLGAIYVFASGNGGVNGDNCNFDGYANSVYTITIGAVTAEGKMPHFGEPCAASLGVSFSGGGGLGIVTTDVIDGCTDKHSGTSAAAPIAAGIIALMLSVRPQLSWRDVQHLIVSAAVPVDLQDEDWSINGAGRLVSHKYGFGALEASKLVDSATRHSLLPLNPSLLNISAFLTPSESIPLQSETVLHGLREKWVPLTLESSITVRQGDAEIALLHTIHHVQVTVRIRHSSRRHLRISLISPSGTRSVLAHPRPRDLSSDGFHPWTFMTVRCWGESPVGTWRLLVEDVRTPGYWKEATDGEHVEPNIEGGTLEMWELKILGECHVYKRDADGRGVCANTENNKTGEPSVWRKWWWAPVLLAFVTWAALARRAVLASMRWLVPYVLLSSHGFKFLQLTDNVDLESPTYVPVPEEQEMEVMHAEERNSLRFLEGRQPYRIGAFEEMQPGDIDLVQTVPLNIKGNWSARFMQGTLNSRGEGGTPSTTQS